MAAAPQGGKIAGSVAHRRPSPRASFLLGFLTAAAVFGGPHLLTGTPALDGHAQSIVAAPPLRAHAVLPLPLPWQPLLSAGQVRRGLGFYGSGRRIERVASRLLAGEPITAVTLGGSVTVGTGSSTYSTHSYPARFFQFLNASFPHRDHVFLNKAIGATSSGLFSVCAEKMLPKESDIIVVELTFNEPADIPMTHPIRRGFEKMLRKLARLPHSPAVIVLHHYAWHYAHGDGMAAGLFYRAAEGHLSTLAQYYDFPAPSLRNAIFPMLQANAAPFKIDRVHKPGHKSLAGHPLRAVPPKLRKDYFYADGVHPSDTGHQAMAELLAAVVTRAVHNLAADGKVPELGTALEIKRITLPPPMIHGVVDAPTSLCALQEDFKPLAHAMSGFAYAAQRPDAATFVQQKWGYSAEQPGAWLELAMSTEEGPGRQGKATVYLGHLRSYAGMGLARVECRSGCTCTPTQVDGLWKQRVSLMQMHAFKVTQHPRCVIRVTNEARGDSSGSGDSSSSGRGSQGGNKFQVSSLMVAHEPLVLSSYAAQATDLAKSMHGR